jgi:integrase
MWHTGCRPQELRAIEAACIDGHKIMLHERTIYLNIAAAGIVRQLAARHPVGPIFRDSNGEPWTKDSLAQAFRQLRDVLGIDGLCAYTFRHLFITRLLKQGIDAATVTAIVGRPTVMAWCDHVPQDECRLLEVVAAA